MIDHFVFSGLIFTTAQVVFITAKIVFVFISESAVHLHDDITPYCLSIIPTCILNASSLKHSKQ